MDGDSSFASPSSSLNESRRSRGSVPQASVSSSSLVNESASPDETFGSASGSRGSSGGGGGSESGDGGVDPKVIVTDLAASPAGKFAEADTADPLTKLEQWAFYAYDIANSGFPNTILQAFMPPLLLLMALGSLCADQDCDCFTDISSFPLCEGNATIGCLNATEAARVAIIAAGNGDTDWRPGGGSWSGSDGLTVSAADFQPIFHACRDVAEESRVGFLFRVKPATLPVVALAISVFFQIILFAIFGGLGDYGGLRKTMLGVTGMLGAAFSCLIFFLWDFEAYVYGALLMVASNVFFGLSIVYYNASLPALVRAHPKYAAAAALPNREKIASDIADSISTRAFLWGYVATLFLLLVNLVVSFTLTAGLEGVELRTYTLDRRLNCVIAAVWWGLGTVFVMYGMKRRPGPDVPPGYNIMTIHVHSLWDSLKKIREVPNLARFLLAYFLYSDGWAIMGSVGSLFAVRELDFTTVDVLIMFLISIITAMPGNFVYYYLKKRFNLRRVTVLKMTVGTLALLPAWALLGVIDASPVGLKSKGEVFLFVVVYGFQVGALQSFSRTLFAAMAPQDHQCEFFSVYEVSDKGSGLIGPVVLAIAFDNVENLRWAMFYVFFFLAIPFVILFFVDEVKAQDEAVAFSKSHARVTVLQLSPVGESAATPMAHIAGGDATSDRAVVA